MNDLWPEEISLENSRSPVGILREQAEFLGLRTKNIVTAEVTLSPKLKNLFEGNDFLHSFYIVAPALGGYKYRLFTIINELVFYPATFDLDEQIHREIERAFNSASSSSDKMGTLEIRKKITFKVDKIVVGDEDSFIHVLKLILQSKRVQQVIQSLIAHSEGATIETLDLPF
jgi:hypothetical protein